MTTRPQTISAMTWESTNHIVPLAFSTIAGFGDESNAISGCKPPSSRTNFLFSVSTAQFQRPPAAFSCTASWVEYKSSINVAIPGSQTTLVYA